MPSFRPAVIDVLHRQVEFVLMVHALAAELGAAIGEHAQWSGNGKRDEAMLPSHPMA